MKPSLFGSCGSSLPRRSHRALRSTPWAALLFGLVSSGCGGGASGKVQRILTPDGMAEPGWTIEDRERDIATRPVRSTQHQSLVWVRVQGAEKPHYHDHTDMTVFVISGRVLMHLGERIMQAGAGDVIDVPRGTLHWVENQSKDASVAFVVFSPAFDGRDYRPER